MQVTRCWDNQASWVGVAVKPHVVVALAHPGQSCVVIDFNGVSPEFCQDFLHDAIEFASAEGSTFFNQGVDLALESRFQQVGDEVVEVGICQAVS